MSTADADRPGWRTLTRRRKSDRVFLRWVRRAGVDGLRAMLKQRLPGWRRVAVQRRLKMREAVTT